MTTPPLKTVKQTGHRLGISPVTVIRLFDAGALPGVIVRQGARKRTIRFCDETLEKFISSREKRASRVEAVSNASDK